MTFLYPTCPQCGAVPRGTVDLIPGCALLDVAPDGSAEYAGETLMDWDGQYNDAGRSDTLSLECPQGHQWETAFAE